MKPAITERDALPVHSTKSSVTGLVQELGGTRVEPVLSMTTCARHKHQVATVGALDHH